METVSETCIAGWRYWDTQTDEGRVDQRRGGCRCSDPDPRECAGTALQVTVAKNTPHWAGH